MRQSFYLFAALLLAVHACGAGEVSSNGPNTVDIVSDQFNSATLDALVWSFVNPLGDATYAMTGSQLAISVPEGTSHDITEDGNFAPVMFQQVYNPQDFEIVVKFDGNMQERFQMQGIQVVQDSLNFLRLEFYNDGPATNRLVWSFVNGRVDSIANQAILPPTSLVYMKIRRVADTWTQHWSVDGENYSFGSMFTRSMIVSRIGVYGSNAGHPAPTAPAFTGLIDYFVASKPSTVALPRFIAKSFDNGIALLEWSTSEGQNLRGFEVQRSPKRNIGFATLPESFVEAHGEPCDYTWEDKAAGSGQWFYRLKLIGHDGTVDFTEPVQGTSVTSVSELIAAGYELRQNFPNPFNPETKIQFSVEKTGHASVRVFNLIGQEVATLFNQTAESGKLYSVNFNGASLTSGIYLYKLESGGRTTVKKLTLVK